MSTKNLTTSQKEIITKLKEEFLALNSIPKKKGNLLDVGEILADFDEGEKKYKEIILLNESISKIREEIYHQTVKKLEGDLDELGLMVLVNEDNEDVSRITITNKGERKMCYSKHLSIEVEMDREYVSINNHAISILSGVFFEYRDGDSVNYRTIEELVSTSIFKRNLNKVYLEAKR